ncbi:MAG: CBS domain-containing protein [Zetaproteobacteria bacterium]|nr:CBS domain-containing protein [Zetaproteobacteria bacterium]
MCERFMVVTPDETLQSIMNKFQLANVHNLAVVDEGKLIGEISDKYVSLAVSPFVNTAAEQHRDVQTLHKHVHQIMNRHVTTLAVDDELDSAVAMMLERDISWLPVVDSEMHLVGVLSYVDILRDMVGFPKLV